MKHGSYRYVDTSLCEDGSIGGWNYTAKSELHEQNDLTFMSFFGNWLHFSYSKGENIQLHVFFSYNILFNINLSICYVIYLNLLDSK